MDNLEAIKLASEGYILKNGGEICDWLPSIGLEELDTRSGSDVARRALVLNVLVNVSFGAPASVARAWLQENDLLSALTPRETEIVNGPEAPEESLELELRWGMESLWAAAWAGQLTDTLSPIEMLSDDLAKMFPSLMTNESPSSFYDRFRLREMAELYSQLDLFYRSHWYARECALNGRSSGNFQLGVIEFRRKLLEWILHTGADWDNVDLST